MTAPDLASTIYLPPTDTVAVWQQREALRPTVNWREMLFEEHAAAFTVARVAQLDLLSAIRQSLDKVIREGGTYAMWKADILPQLKDAGWWGLVSDPAITGTSEPVIINDARLPTIFRTNIRMSQAGGLWRRIQRDKQFAPYLRYLSHHYRKHPRKDHYSWHGLVIPVDDPAWQWMFPPNGWGCKCHVQQVTAGMIQRNGWRIDKAPAPMMRGFETPSGRINVPRQVDPGFGYNPGFAHLRVLTEKLTRSIEQALAVGNDVAARSTLRSIIAEPAFEQFAALKEGAFPVAILSESQQQEIQAASRLVMLPGGVYSKQLGEQPLVSAGHLDLTLDDYRLLPDIIDNALIVAKQDDIRLIYFADEAGRIWKAVVRQDVNRTNPAIVSFHRSNASKMRRETRKLDILVDRQ